MVVTGYGNASVKIASGDTSLLFDPYHKDLVEVREPAQRREKRREAFLEETDIFITHGHFDHMGSIVSLYRERDVQVYCTETPAATLVRLGFPPERVRVVAPGETLAFGNMTVRAYQGMHCKFNAGEIANVIFRHHAFRHMRPLYTMLRLNRVYPEGGECLMYEICAEGQRLQLLGSAGLAADTDYPTGADVLILPYQGRSDMAAYCMGLVERLRPKRVIMDHFEDAFPPVTCREPVEEFVELMQRRHPGIPCQALEEQMTVCL